MQLDRLSTSDLKTLIRRYDDQQEEAVLELCTRHDAGDLVEFFRSLKFQPANLREFVMRAKEYGVTVANTATAANKSEQHVKNIRYETSRGVRRNAAGEYVPIDQVGTRSRTGRDNPDRSNIIPINRPARRKYESACGLGLDTRANGEIYGYQRINVPNVLSGRLFVTKETLDRGEVDLSNVNQDRLFDLIELLQNVYRKIVH